MVERTVYEWAEIASMPAADFASRATWSTKWKPMSRCGRS